MKSRGLFTDRFPKGMNWENLPGLDDLAPGSGEQKAQAKEAAGKLCETMINIFTEHDFKTLGLELSVLSRRANDEIDLFTTFFWARRYQGLLSNSPVNVASQERRDSAYVEAMRLMATDVPDGGFGPEPIVLHPQLREADLQCVVVTPEQYDPISINRAFAIVRADKPEKYAQSASGERVRVSLKASSKYVSDVENRIERFRTLFNQRVEQLATTSSNQQIIDKQSELNNAIIVAVPLFREGYHSPVETLLGQEEPVFNTAVSGIVALAWIIPPPEILEPEIVKRAALAAGRDVSDFFLSVAIRDMKKVAEHAGKSVQALRTAYHDIYNVIAEYSTQMVAQRLFFRGDQDLRNFKYKLRRRTTTTGRLTDEEKELAHAALMDMAALRKFKSHAAILEIQWSGSAVRKKFQDNSTFLISKIIEDVFAECAKYKSNSAAGVLDPVRMVLRWHTNWMREAIDGNYDFEFPSNYLSSTVIREQMFEIFLNARKHGRRGADGAVTINVEISGEYHEDHGLEPSVVIKIRNEIQGRQAYCRKEYMLGLVRGISVSDVIKKRENLYEVKAKFGPVTVEGLVPDKEIEAMPRVVSRS